MIHNHEREMQGHNCTSLWPFFYLLLLPEHPHLAIVINRLLTPVDLRLIPMLLFMMMQEVIVLFQGRLALSGGNADV